MGDSQSKSKNSAIRRQTIMMSYGQKINYKEYNDILIFDIDKINAHWDKTWRVQLIKFLKTRGIDCSWKMYSTDKIFKNNRKHIESIPDANPPITTSGDYQPNTKNTASNFYDTLYIPSNIGNYIEYPYTGYCHNEIQYRIEQMMYNRSENMYF